MCDLIVLWLVVRHLRQVCEQKQQPTSGIVISSVAIYIGLEVLGIVIGLTSGGQVGAILGAVLGAATGAIVAVLRAGSLPDNRAADQGPQSMGPQVVGSNCAVCAERIATVAGASKCPACGAPCHDDCMDAHRATHSQAKPPKPAFESVQ